MLTKEQIINKTIISEGGYTAPINGDTGGETYKGIARNYHPRWSGWAIVDGNKPLKKGAIIKNKTLDALVAKFYEENFYNAAKCDQYESSVIKMQVYDLAVNAGIKRACITLQKAVNAIYKANISVDGLIGKITLGYVNKKDKIAELGKAFRDQRIAYYKSIGVGSRAKFLKGWVNRANEIYEYAVKNS